MIDIIGDGPRSEILYLRKRKNKSAIRIYVKDPGSLSIAAT